MNRRPKNEDGRTARTRLVAFGYCGERATLSYRFFNFTRLTAFLLLPETERLGSEAAGAGQGRAGQDRAGQGRAGQFVPKGTTNLLMPVGHKGHRINCCQFIVADPARVQSVGAETETWPFQLRETPPAKVPAFVVDCY